MKEVEISSGQTKYLDNGIKLSAKHQNPLLISTSPGKAAIAEAKHAVVNPDNVEYIKIDGEGGLTKLKSPDAVQAAAHHGSGDGHDRRVVEYMGANYDAASQSADARLMDKTEEIMTLAGYIERNTSISGSEVVDVLDRVRKGDEVELEIERPDGKTKTEIIKGVKSGETIYAGDLLENEWFEIEKAA
jgi:hypothetical protein